MDALQNAEEFMQHCTDKLQHVSFKRQEIFLDLSIPIIDELLNYCSSFIQRHMQNVNCE